MKARCEHCGKFKETVVVGKWNLCLEHKELKQFQPKQSKVYKLKRTPIKVNKDYRIKRTPIKQNPNHKIKQVSKKQQVKNSVYNKVAINFKKKNPVCNIQIEDHCTFHTSDIHHKKGRIGFADDYAREINMPLLIDERYFEAACRSCHDFVENNPEFAYQNGYSIRRNS